jgi:hypothetical protein
MIKLKSLLKENRKNILVMRRSAEERNKNRLNVLLRQIPSNIKNGVYEGDLDLQ